MSKLAFSLTGTDVPPQVASLDPAMQMALYQLSKVLIKDFQASHLIIKDSVLEQRVNQGRLVIHADLNELLKAQVSIGFYLNWETQRGLRSVCGKEETNYFADLASNLYLATDGRTTVHLHMVEGLESQMAPCPEEGNWLGEVVSEVNLTSLRCYVKKASCVYLRVFADQLEQIQVQWKPAYTFNPMSWGSLHSKSPDRIMLSTHFLAGMNRTELSLRLMENSAGTWLVSSSKHSHDLTLTTYELLTDC